MAGFTAGQLAQIRAILIELKGQNGGQGPPGPPDENGNSGNHGVGFTPEEVGFFDPLLNQAYGPGPVITVGEDAVYRDVHLFMERLRDVAMIKGELTERSSHCLVHRYAGRV